MKHLLLVLLAMISYSLQKTMAQESILPIDPKVRIGKLDNGLTYYIRKMLCRKTEQTLFRTKSGVYTRRKQPAWPSSFLEHMCFMVLHIPVIPLTISQTDRCFPKCFHRNVETVYHMCDVPVDIPGAIDTCLLISA